MEEKKRLESWKKVLIAAVAFVLIAALAVGAVYYIRAQRATDADDDAYAQEVSDIAQKEVDYSGAAEYVEGAVESTPISLSAKGLEAFERYLAGVRPAYEHSDLFGIDAAWKKYKNNAPSVKSHAHDVRVGGQLDAQALYQLVLENNEAFLQAHPETKEKFDITSKKEIREYCEKLCEVIPIIKKHYPEIDMDTVCCNLYDLKMFTSNSMFSNAFINEDNIFSFNKDNMQGALYFEEDMDMETAYFYHEMVHACQICCDCYTAPPVWRVGVCSSTANSQTDALFWNWYIEGATEMLSSAVLDIGYTTYDTYISYVDALDFIAQLDSAVGVRQIERSTFGHDIGKFPELLDIQSDSEREEFLKMMCALDVLDAESTDFYELYNVQAGISGIENEQKQEESKAALQQQMKEDAFLTMSKLFYRNLARQMQAGNTTLEDAQYLIKIWENILCYQFDAHYYGGMADFGTFCERYLPIQDSFFALIAKENGMQQTSLESGLEAFVVNNLQPDGSYLPNCTAAFFTEDEMQYLSKTAFDYYRVFSPTVRECVTLAQQCQAAIEKNGQ